MAQSSGYDCRSRSLMFKLAARLQIGYTEAITLECALADYAMVAEDEVSDEVKAESDKRRRSDKFIRRFKIGLGTVAGGVLIGVTGGLAAPLVAAGATAALGATAGAAVASGGVRPLRPIFGPFLRVPGPRTCLTRRPACCGRLPLGSSRGWPVHPSAVLLAIPPHPPPTPRLRSQSQSHQPRIHVIPRAP